VSSSFGHGRHTHGAAVSHPRGYALRAAAGSKANERSRMPVAASTAFEGRVRAGLLCGRGKFCRAVRVP